MEQLNLNGTILVVVPHSDDEIILYGGLIQRALAQNQSVYVALVTNGDYEATTEAEGICRPLETIQGLRVLCVPEDHVFIMGYADIGMPKAESFFWQLWEETDSEKVLHSHVGIHTYGPETHPDFHTARHGVPGAYTKAGFQEDLAELLDAVNPDMVFTTHPADAHGDHAGLFQFLRGLVPADKLYTAYCHSPQGDAVWPLEGNQFTCPPGMEQNWAHGVKLDLTAEEVSRKAKALEMHKAALKPDAVVFLRSFVKHDEIYFPVEERI